MSDRTGKEASAADLWQGLKIRMDDRQASNRRSWLRSPLTTAAPISGIPTWRWGTFISALSGAA